MKTRMMRNDNCGKSRKRMTIKFLVSKKRKRDPEDMDAKVGQEGKEVKGIKRKDYKL
jgi:hypothetical protein